MFRGRVPKSRPIGVISKTLRILELLDLYPAGFRLKDVPSVAHISKTTACRILAHLETEGFLFRDDSGAYAVGPKLLKIGCGPAQHMALRKVSRPLLQSLRDATRETVNLGILLGHEVFYVDVLQGRNPFPMASCVGTLRPLYCTAMGKALASSLKSHERARLFSSLRFHNFTRNTISGVSQFRDELSRIQTQGYAVDNEEAVFGARCVSVPIDLWGGKLLAAVSVSALVARMRCEEIPSFATALRNVAREIAANLQSSPPPAIFIPVSGS